MTQEYMQRETTSQGSLGNEKELLKTVKTMNSDRFQELIEPYMADLKKWISKNLESADLASKLNSSLTKEAIIQALQTSIDEKERPGSLFKNVPQRPSILNAQKAQFQEIDLKERKLQLGVGTQPKEGYVNMDVLELEGVDVVHDADKFPYPFKDNAFKYMFSQYVFEHLDNIGDVLKELHRCCEEGAILEIVVPHYTHHRAFGDLTHTHFFSYTSFDNYVVNKGNARNVNYYQFYGYELVEKEIYFYQKGKPGLGTKFLLPFQVIINKIPTIYERFFCYLLPATQLRFKLKVIKNESKQ